MIFSFLQSFWCQDQVVDARVMSLVGEWSLRYRSFPSAEGTVGLALSLCWTIWSPEIICLDFHLFWEHKLPGVKLGFFNFLCYSNLLFHLLLFNGAHCSFQEINNCCLVFSRVLSQMLHMCWPRKPEKKTNDIQEKSAYMYVSPPDCWKFGALPSAFFKHFTLKVLLWEVVVVVGVKEQLLHLLVQLEMVPTKVTRPYTLHICCF